MNESIFRYYDIRGKVGKDFQVEDAYSIAQAIAYYFHEQDPTVKRVAVGMDGRTHSPLIKEQVVSGLRDSGYDVTFIGMCPTPVLYFTLFTQNIDAGIMITASHNGPQYNGLKINFKRQAVALEQMAVLREMWRSGKSLSPTVQGAYTEKMMNPIYIDFLVEHFAHLKNSMLPLVIDCGSGATATIMPELVKRMGWQKAMLLYDEIDGEFSQHLPDPTVDENVQVLRKCVQEHKCTGAAFDGDGDRMVPMTKEGYLVPGDKMLALYAHSMLSHYKNFPVIFDVKSSAKLVDLLNSWQLKPVMSPTGHAYIKKAMREYQGLVAGEISCHFFFADRYFGFDDGIYALMRLVEVLETGNKDLTELLSIFPASYTTPEIRLLCEQDKDKEAISAIKTWYASRKDVSITTIDGARIIFADGWGLVRASNTEPLLSLRFEAESQEALAQHKKEFAVLLAPYIDHTLIEENLLHE